MVKLSSYENEELFYLSAYNRILLLGTERRMDIVDNSISAIVTFSEGLLPR